MAKYNGFKNRLHYMVSMHINNHEETYRLARVCIRSQSNRKNAAHVMLAMLTESGNSTTPDGIPYSVSSILSAMRGM